jgi:hypothetical protein
MRGAGYEAVVLHCDCPCNKADAVRSACLKGKKMAIKIREKTSENISVAIFMKSMCTLESKKKKCSSPFFYE